MSRVARAWLAAALLLPAAACASGGSGGGGSDALTVAAETEPDCLDPQMSALDATANIDRSIFDSLVSMTPDGGFHPWLAERWDVSKDGRAYTFHLRSGVRFHDGTAFDAAAVKATLDHAVAPRTKSRYAATLIHSFRTARVVDARTVKVGLVRPDAAFLQALSTPYLGVQSARSLGGDPAGLCTRPVGTGPFKFAGWARNKSIALTRNTGYAWPPAGASPGGAAQLEKLTVAFVPEPVARLGMLTSREADVVDNVPTPNARSLRSAGRYRLLSGNVPGAVFGVFLNSTHGVLTDERVRLAFIRSINLDQFVRTVYFGEATRAWSLLAPGTVGYSAKTQGSWPYDPALAGRLLDQAGWTGRDSAGYRTKDGRRLTLRWPWVARLMRDRRDVLAQGIQAQAKRAGIHVDLFGRDGGALTQDVLSGRGMDLFGSSFARAEPDILRYFFASDQSPDRGGGNFFHLRDPRLDGWLRDAGSTADPAERARLYAHVQQYVLDHGLVLPTYNPVRLVATSKRVRGLTYDANSYPLFREVRLEGE